jgi:hypothetical protein
VSGDALMPKNYLQKVVAGVQHERNIYGACSPEGANGAALIRAVTGAVSPWGLDKLPDFGVDTTVAEAVRMRPANIKRVLIRRRPLHPFIRRSGKS